MSDHAKHTVYVTSLQGCFCFLLKLRLFWQSPSSKAVLKHQRSSQVNHSTHLHVNWKKNRKEKARVFDKPFIKLRRNQEITCVSAGQVQTEVVKNIGHVIKLLCKQTLICTNLTAHWSFSTSSSWKRSKNHNQRR